MFNILIYLNFKKKYINISKKKWKILYKYNNVFKKIEELKDKLKFFKWKRLKRNKWYKKRRPYWKKNFKKLKENLHLKRKKFSIILKTWKRRKNLSSMPFFFPPYIDLNYKLFLFTLWKHPYWHEIPFFTKFDMAIISGMNLKVKR